MELLHAVATQAALVQLNRECLLVFVVLTFDKIHFFNHYDNIIIIIIIIDIYNKKYHSMYKCTMHMHIEGSVPWASFKSQNRADF